MVVAALDYYPSSSSQAGEYLILRNTTAAALDLTGWRLSGAVAHTFTPGTVIPAGAGTPAVEYQGLLHIVKNAAAFRARNSGPRAGRSASSRATTPASCRRGVKPSSFMIRTTR